MKNEVMYEQMLDKAMESQVKLAMARARESVCYSCIDKKCLVDSFCRSFYLIYLDHLRQIAAEIAVQN